MSAQAGAKFSLSLEQQLQALDERAGWRKVFTQSGTTTTGTR